jgi:hypothetical protein
MYVSFIADNGRLRFLVTNADARNYTETMVEWTAQIDGTINGFLGTFTAELAYIDGNQVRHSKSFSINPNEQESVTAWSPVIFMLRVSSRRLTF